MRIALTVNYSPWSSYGGGGQRSAHSLACALSRAGHDVHVVYTRPPWEAIPVPESLPYRVHWATLAAVRSDRSALLRPLSSFSVARLLEALQPDVVHANGEEAAVAAHHRRILSGPFVVTPRYPSFPSAMKDGSWRLRPLQRLRHLMVHTKYAALGFALAGADRTCPTSRDSAKLVQQVFGVRPKRVRVVPNGVERPFFERRWASPPRERVLFFGRFASEKGVFDLVEALGLMRDPPHTTLVGRGSALAKLRARAEALGLAGRVRFESWQGINALADAIASASLVVVPSWEESFGNTIAEAMSVGAPIVTTACGSIPELVEQERSALMVPAKDPGQLAMAIDRLRDDPELAARLGTAARQRAEARFSWDKVAEAYVRIYREIPS